MAFSPKVIDGECERQGPALLLITTKNQSAALLLSWLHFSLCWMADRGHLSRHSQAKANDGAGISIHRLTTLISADISD